MLYWKDKEIRFMENYCTGFPYLSNESILGPSPLMGFPRSGGSYFWVTYMPGEFLVFRTFGNSWQCRWGTQKCSSPDNLVPLGFLNWPEVKEEIH